MEKQRLDFLLKELGYFESREKSQNAIKQGYVKIDNILQTSPAKKFDSLKNHKIQINQDANKYVSRGAYKLEKALKVFDIDVAGKIAIDIGASTGGFSDVLLQNKVKKIYAIDVGKSQLHEKIKSNSNVISMEETDFRSISKSQVQDANLVVIDVSFISILPIVQKLKELFSGEDIEIVSLIKPQFECGKDIARKHNGIIKDKKVHKQVIFDVLNFWEINGFKVQNLTFSPIKGGDGNVEYLLYTKTTSTTTNFSTATIDNLIEQAFKQ